MEAHQNTRTPKHSDITSDTPEVAPDHLLPEHLDASDAPQEEPPLLEEIDHLEEKVAEVEEEVKEEVEDVLDDMASVLEGLIQRARLPRLLQHHKSLPVLALFTFINSCISIGLISTVAYFTHSPFIFPSLGPTAFLFFYKPRAVSATPRNAILGHAIGAIVGYLCLLATGLIHAGPALQVGITWPRIIAATLSLSLTSALMILLRAPHPPAGATTLIVSLGIFSQPWQLVLLMLAVGLLTLQAIIINRLAGLPYPLWGHPTPIKPSSTLFSKPMKPPVKSKR